MDDPEMTRVVRFLHGIACKSSKTVKNKTERTFSFKTTDIIENSEKSI